MKHNGRVTDPERRWPATDADRDQRVSDDTEATEYVRTMDDKELVGLTVMIAQRVAALTGQGVNLPMAQIENHHLIGLLECFVGPEESLRVREWHLTWLDRKLDAVKAQMRIQMLGAMQ